MNMRPSIPILRSFDEAKAKEFYVDFLDFEIFFEHRFEPDLPLYMGLIKDTCVLHISEHHGDACPGSAVRIEVDDVDAYCKQLNKKRYQNARPEVMEQPWGFRDMCIDDPAGNRLIFCTPIEDTSS